MTLRFIIPISLGILLLAILLPMFLVESLEVSGPPFEQSPESPVPPPTPTPRPNSPPPGPGDGLDDRLILQVLIGEEVQAMSMSEFLVGVVAAEMPARFHPEALRAQAVAARTYTLHRMFMEPAGRHPEAYVCGSFACCKAFHSTERLRERWGAQFDHYHAIIRLAVSETDGLILLYEELPILAAFHSSSHGFTEAAGAVWNSRPYLQSVRSFEGAFEVPRFTETRTLPYGEFREIALGGVTGARLDYDDRGNWITGISYTDSGRISHLYLGGVRVRGGEFRRLFSLRSAAIDFAFDDSYVTITTNGYGHGVGMSQFGANTKANLGLTFDQILDWYYTDVTLGRVDTLFYAAE